MDKKKKEQEQTFSMSDAINAVKRATAKEILQELYNRAMRNDYSVIYLEDIIELSKKYGIEVN